MSTDEAINRPCGWFSITPRGTNYLQRPSVHQERSSAWTHLLSWVDPTVHGTDLSWLGSQPRHKNSSWWS